MKNLLTVSFLFFLVVFNCLAESNESTIEPDGRSSVRADSKSDQVVATFITRKVDIGRPSEGRPTKIMTSCTYSRYPCSLIDNLEIEIGRKAIIVPRSSYADLSDVVSVHIKALKSDYVLLISGGDASESYTAKIIFDSKGIKQRLFYSDLAPDEVLQKTYYYSSKGDLTN